MAEEKFVNAVRLDKEKCKGCTNCIKRCPTGAIRVRNGKAKITKSYCIDCGECIRICEHHAKIATYDPVSSMDDYEYKVALPAPALYGQYNNLEDTNILLTALKYMGFDDVFEVGAAAEIVSQMTREFVSTHRDMWPLISTACPSVTRLIRIRFPNLISHLLPLEAPVEVAATLARRKAMAVRGLPSEKIGIFFISPCPAKVSACRSPLGITKCDVDKVLAIKDIYPLLLPLMKKAALNPDDLASAGRIGLGWGQSGGEAAGLLTDCYLAADGIENVIDVLEDLEDQKLLNLKFIELNACRGGCVGGVLTVENPYVARVKLKRLNRYLPVAVTHGIPADVGYWTREIKYEPVFKLGSNLRESMQMMFKVELLEKQFPGTDCGSCGAPSCHALAEDIVRGVAKKTDCVHVLRKYIQRISGEMHDMSENPNADYLDDDPDE